MGQMRQTMTREVRLDEGKQRIAAWRAEQPDGLAANGVAAISFVARPPMK